MGSTISSLIIPLPRHSVSRQLQTAIEAHAAYSALGPLSVSAAKLKASLRRRVGAWSLQYTRNLHAIGKKELDVLVEEVTITRQQLLHAGAFWWCCALLRARGFFFYEGGR